MAWVALKAMEGPGGTRRLPGDVMPEVAGWKNRHPWVNGNYIKWVLDTEISGNRWSNYEAYAGSALGAHRTHADAPASHGAVAKAASVVPAPHEPELAAEDDVQLVPADTSAPTDSEESIPIKRKRGRPRRTEA